MKKILIAVAITLIGSSAAFAAQSIKLTKHNLSSTATSNNVRSTDQSQICIFCHTPHNAVPSVPLWNRDGSGGAYKLYTSSATLTSATKASSLNADSYSMMCLSCHDASSDQVIGDRVNGLASVPTMTGTNWLTGGGNIGSGQDLTNDHPIGFSYSLAATEDSTGLRAIGTANSNLGLASGTAFPKNKTSGMTDVMECSSCHLVHDNTNAPFLRISNAGSALCLACHNK